jgi:hypothetical protein
VNEFIEIESGRKISRPQLAAAMQAAKDAGAVLLVQGKWGWTNRAKEQTQQQA